MHNDYIFSTQKNSSESLVLLGSLDPPVGIDNATWKGVIKHRNHPTNINKNRSCLYYGNSVHSDHIFSMQNNS